MVPGQERGPLLGQSISTGQARVKQHPASEGILVRYRGGGRVAVVDRPAEHWLEEELREDVERPDDARIPIARLARGIDHGPELWPGTRNLYCSGRSFGSRGSKSSTLASTPPASVAPTLSVC